MDEHAGCGAGESDLREHVGRKALPTQHDEVAGDSRQHGDHGPGQQRVLHEVELQQQLDVRHHVQRGSLVGHQWSSG